MNDSEAKPQVEACALTRRLLEISESYRETFRNAVENRETTIDNYQDGWMRIGGFDVGITVTPLKDENHLQVTTNMGEIMKLYISPTHVTIHDLPEAEKFRIRKKTWIKEVIDSELLPENARIIDFNEYRNEFRILFESDGYQSVDDIYL